MVSGVRSVLFEMAYNLGDNAIRYNVPGGTGLGLSIVKHAVQYHHGRIDISSEVGKGTAITVTLEKRP